MGMGKTGRELVRKICSRTPLPETDSGACVIGSPDGEIDHEVAADLAVLDERARRDDVARQLARQLRQ